MFNSATIQNSVLNYHWSYARIENNIVLYTEYWVVFLAKFEILTATYFKLGIFANTQWAQSSRIYNVHVSTF